jgi:hypothetical protein
MNREMAPADHMPGCRRKLRRVIRQRNIAVAAVGVSLFAISVGAYGGDLGTSYATAMAPLSQPSPVGRRPLRAAPIDPPDAGPDLAAQHARIVDQLYEELMRRTPPGCSSTSSMGGAC